LTRFAQAKTCPLMHGTCPVWPRCFAARLMNKLPCLFFWLLLPVVMITVETSSAAHTPEEVQRLWTDVVTGGEQDSFHGLREGWSYRYSTADIDLGSADVLPGDLSGESGWRSWSWTKPAANTEQANRLWLRTTLPETAYPDKVLLMAGLQCDAVAVFLGGKQIYASGSFGRDGASGRPANRLHWIPLPSDAGGVRVHLAFFNARPDRLTMEEPILLYAPQSELMQRLMSDAWYKQAFGFLFLFVGIYALVAHFVRRQYGLSFSPWFAFLTVTLGLSQLFAGNMMFMVYDRAEWFYRAGLLAMLVFPIGLWRFIEISFGPGWQQLIRRCWQLQILVVVVIWLPDAMGWYPFGPAGQVLGNAALALQLLVGLGEGWRHLVNGEKSTSLTALWLLLFSLAGLLDIAAAFLPFSLGTELYPWGALALIAVLAVGQERAAGEAQIQLRRQADALQRQQQHLEELVEERTAELHLATRAAEAASRAKSEFLANMSHELRTPLNAILGYAHLIGRDRGVARDHRERAAIIRQSGEHLLLLINDILDISKIEAGKIEIQPDRVRLPELISGVVDMIKPRAEARALSFVYEPAPTLPREVVTDEKRVRQLLLNLLSNAVKFTDRGEVRLTAGRQADKLVFQVSDTGIGIDAAYLETIFEPFQQLSGPAQHEGAGLGLAISRTIARKMNGDLLVRSAPGQGSIFRLELPCVAATSANQAVPTAAEETAGSPAVAVPDPLPADYAVLCDAARIGDIARIIKESERLKERLPEHLAFIEHVCRLAADFDIKALQRLLARHPSDPLSAPVTPAE